MERITNVKEAIRLLTDQAQELGADANDSTGIVRHLVTAHGLSFEAWFCVCCELADRNAQREGFKNQVDRAANSPAVKYILDTCRQDLEPLARDSAEGALYLEPGEHVISGIASASDRGERRQRMDDYRA